MQLSFILIILMCWSSWDLSQSLFFFSYKLSANWRGSCHNTLFLLINMKDLSQSNFNYLQTKTPHIYWQLISFLPGVTNSFWFKEILSLLILVAFINTMHFAQKFSNIMALSCFHVLYKTVYIFSKKLSKTKQLLNISILLHEIQKFLWWSALYSISEFLFRIPIKNVYS